MVKANHALSNSAQNYKMEELVNSSNPQKFWSTVKNLSTKSVNSQDLSVPAPSSGPDSMVRLGDVLSNIFPTFVLSILIGLCL